MVGVTGSIPVAPTSRRYFGAMGWQASRESNGQQLIAWLAMDLKHHFPSSVSFRSRSLLIKASAPPEAITEANSSRRVARSLMVPLR
jgi:hypothetical protein